MDRASSASSSCSSTFASAATLLIKPSAAMKERGKRSPLIGKFSTARWVCAPYSASAGTVISPSESFSTRVCMSTLGRSSGCVLMARRPRRPHLDAARQRTLRCGKQIEYQRSNVLRLHFPIIIIVAARRHELGRHTAGHDVADAHAIVTDFLHQRLAESNQTEFAGVVCGTARERILAGEAADVDDPAAAACDQMRQRGVRAVEHAVQVRLDHHAPGVRLELRNGPKPADSRVVDEDVDL